LKFSVRLTAQFPVKAFPTLFLFADFKFLQRERVKRLIDYSFGYAVVGVQHKPSLFLSQTAPATCGVLSECPCVEVYASKTDICLLRLSNAWNTFCGFSVLIQNQ
jgi:hypothetical protein